MGIVIDLEDVDPYAPYNVVLATIVREVFDTNGFLNKLGNSNIRPVVESTLEDAKEETNLIMSLIEQIQSVLRLSNVWANLFSQKHRLSSNHEFLKHIQAIMNITPKPTEENEQVAIAVVNWVKRHQFEVAKCYEFLKIDRTTDEYDSIFGAIDPSVFGYAILDFSSYPIPSSNVESQKLLNHLYKEAHHIEYWSHTKNSIDGYSIKILACEYAQYPDKAAEVANTIAKNYFNSAAELFLQLTNDLHEFLKALEYPEELLNE
jgi:hypothetical protein